VLDGLQLAYKITANSLYGQIGARTSPLYLKQIAACTTATGRKMILMAKTFLEQDYGANVVYGDTDSIFVTFPKNVPLGKSGVIISETGKQAIMPSIRLAIQASAEFKAHLKPPHDLEYEKTFWPWIIFSKKRYVGNVYELDDTKFKQKSMGIVLKRRDNAPIVKKIYGGCIDIILTQQDILTSVDFLKASLQDLVDGKTPLEDLVITKTLRAEYKNPDQIAHQVLAQRMGERDPGNKPQVNDRVPFVYIETSNNADKGRKVLQGERIEHPDYIRDKKIRPDYRFYITNQIMKPVQQLYSLALDQLPNCSKKSDRHWQNERAKWVLEYAGDIEKADDKIQALKEAEAKVALFDPVLRAIDHNKSKMSEITFIQKWFGQRVNLYKN
jgi:DNA polymerase elongation subunit (family B)